VQRGKVIALSPFYASQMPNLIEALSDWSNKI
jgi:hypothetical protein